MKKNHFKIIIAAILAVAIMPGCTKKLDLKPTNDITADDVYFRKASRAGHIAMLAKWDSAQIPR